MTDISTSPESTAFSPTDDANWLIVGQKTGLTLFNESYLDVIQQLPLPGLVIFVHGVNSDGEWYSETEEGICSGLNERLKRRNEHLHFPTPEGGQLRPTKYITELTPEGYLNPEMNPKSFIDSDDTFSPVIRFRWGYKASLEELQQFGDGIYINEQNYWGGGPFANGCTSLPDLWGEGLSEELFLWLHVQHMNPTNDRNVYACPPRPYYVLAALRLARLVESLRKKQADVPITIVCHSQGNMVGIAAAFLGDRLNKDCVADNYVLCNPPYSLLEKNGTESWSQGGMKDPQGHTGRVTSSARREALAAFFNLVGDRKAKHQEVARIDKRMSNTWHGFTAQGDRDKYGYKGSTYGRVTLYCNPHDQVISSGPVQGIGWRGMAQKEITACDPDEKVFTQRVFAQGHDVGVQGDYRYWKDQYNQPEEGSWDFWMPNSPKVRYSVRKGVDANKGDGLATIMTFATAPIAIIATLILGMRINGLPDKGWTIPIKAPALPPFKPQAKRFGVMSEKFDQGFDAPGDSRDKDRTHDADDPFAGDREINAKHTEGTTEPRAKTDAAQGNVDSEAGLSYEYHALMRMQAKRDGRYKSDQQVTEEDDPSSASAGYTAWRNERIKTTLAANLDTHATDHSTIMTNGMHAEKALAYDVAIGCCDIREEDLHKMRVAADWRFLQGLDKDDPNKVFQEYFQYGLFKNVPTFNWANRMGSDGSIPLTIANRRKDPPESKPAAPQAREHH